MRLRICLIAASLLLLNGTVPATFVSHLAASAPPAADMDAERAMLQALMTRRRNLIAQLVAQNGERGRLLAWTILRTADSLL